MDLARGTELVLNDCLNPTGIHINRQTALTVCAGGPGKSDRAGLPDACGRPCIRQQGDQVGLILWKVARFCGSGQLMAVDQHSGWCANDGGGAGGATAEG